MCLWAASSLFPRPCSTGLPLVREKSGKFKVRERSGNFVLGQVNLRFWKSQVNTGKSLESHGNLTFSCHTRNAAMPRT